MKKIIITLLLCLSNIGFASDKGYLLFHPFSEVSVTKLIKGNYRITSKELVHSISYLNTNSLLHAGKISQSDLMKMYHKDYKNTYISVIDNNTETIYLVGKVINMGIEETNNKKIVLYELKSVYENKKKRFPSKFELKNVTMYYKNVNWNPSGF